MKLESLNLEKFKPLNKAQLAQLTGGIYAETGKNEVEINGRIYSSSCDESHDNGDIYFWIDATKEWYKY